MDFNFEHYLGQGLTYEQYLRFFEENTQAVKRGESVDIIHSDTLPLNWQRQKRNEEQFELSTELRAALDSLHQPVTWLVITEPWCGDSAQCLPGIQKVAEAAGGKIVLKIVLRDQHPELIDAFLTNGSRSIPKLIQLDGGRNIMATWGPRPQEAIDLVKRIKDDPALADKYKEELHRWYHQDRMKALQEELLHLLAGTKS